ncbi:MAG: hypothetical protein IKM30_00750 [Oscillospiraceae bacterium]|nr:hypothetical protein [Oscillospiraceae bacterium]
MKWNRITAMFTALMLGISLSGCDMVEQFLDRSNADNKNKVALTPEQEAKRYDLTVMEETVTALKDRWTMPNQEESIQRDIEWLIHELDEAAAIYSRSQLDYYADWNNPALEAMYDKAYEDYYIASELICWAFCNGYSKSAYPELFESYIEEDWLAYYITISLSRLKSYAKSDSSEYGDMLDSYYEISNDTDLSEDEIELQCAQIYLDTLAAYDTSDCLYDYYSRDYTAADISALYEMLVEDLVPLYDTLYETLVESDTYDKIAEADLVVEDPFATILQYAPKISSEIAESAEKLVNEKLYCVAEGDDCYDGCYTVTFPNEQSAMIYHYRGGDYYDLYSAIHEFGHFHSDWRDTTPLYLQENCIDIAEVQSQGMSMLYTAFYDEIYGEYADYLKLAALYDLVDSVVCGFAIGEFEIRVMQDLEHLKAKDVVKIFHEIAEECGISYSLSEVTHLYEQPGYYISYGVSAMAALQIYAQMQEDFDDGLALYEAIAGVSSVDGKYQLMDAMEHCGFSSLFEADTIADMMEQVELSLQQSSIRQ